MKSEHSWCCPMMWDTSEPLPIGRENDRIVIMNTPWGAITLEYKHGVWFWSQEAPKCPYGINPCALLEAKCTEVMGPMINAWVGRHRPRPVGQEK